MSDTINIIEEVEKEVLYDLLKTIIMKKVEHGDMKWLNKYGQDIKDLIEENKSLFINHQVKLSKNSSVNSENYTRVENDYYVLYYTRVQKDGKSVCKECEKEVVHKSEKGHYERIHPDIEYRTQRKK